VKGPDGAEASLIVEAKRTLIPRDAADAVMQLRSYSEQAGMKDATLVVVARFLSETAREQIARLNANYIDSTGNILIRAQWPALFIKQGGATKDPWPSDDTLRTLKGRGAGRALRALLDFQRRVEFASLLREPRCHSAPCHERSTCSTAMDSSPKMDGGPSPISTGKGSSGGGPRITTSPPRTR
jgi:hypothetical protein